MALDVVDPLQAVEIGIDEEAPASHPGQAGAKLEEGLAIEGAGERIGPRQPPFADVGAPSAGDDGDDDRQGDEADDEIPRQVGGAVGIERHPVDREPQHHAGHAGDEAGAPAQAPGRQAHGEQIDRAEPDFGSRHGVAEGGKVRTEQDQEPRMGGTEPDQPVQRERQVSSRGKIREGSHRRIMARTV